MQQIVSSVKTDHDQLVWGVRPPAVHSFHNRWADLQLDGTVQTIDQCISGMVELTELASKRQTEGCPEFMEEVLDDLEAAAYAILWPLCRILALEPVRMAKPPFDAGTLLYEVVGQYFPYMPSSVAQAIRSGTESTRRCIVGFLSLKELDVSERNYREWAARRLVRHLLPYTD